MVGAIDQQWTFVSDDAAATPRGSSSAPYPFTARGACSLQSLGGLTLLGRGVSEETSGADRVEISPGFIVLERFITSSDSRGIERRGGHVVQCSRGRWATLLYGTAPTL